MQRISEKAIQLRFGVQKYAARQILLLAEQGYRVFVYRRGADIYPHARFPLGKAMPEMNLRCSVTGEHFATIDYISVCYVNDFNNGYNSFAEIVRCPMHYLITNYENSRNCVYMLMPFNGELVEKKGTGILEENDLFFIYIGITGQKPIERLRQHIRSANGAGSTRLYRAVRSYRLNITTMDVICVAQDREEVFRIEAEEIAFGQTTGERGCILNVMNSRDAWERLQRFGVKPKDDIPLEEQLHAELERQIIRSASKDRARNFTDDEVMHILYRLALGDSASYIVRSLNIDSPARVYNIKNNHTYKHVPRNMIPITWEQPVPEDFGV